MKALMIKTTLILLAGLIIFSPFALAQEDEDDEVLLTSQIGGVSSDTFRLKGANITPAEQPQSGGKVVMETEERNAGGEIVKQVIATQGVKGLRYEESPQYVAGNVIVKFASGMTSDKINALAVENGCTVTKVLSQNRNTYLLGFNADENTSKDMIAKLQKAKGVENAQPNYIYHSADTVGPGGMPPLDMNVIGPNWDLIHPEAPDLGTIDPDHKIERIGPGGINPDLITEDPKGPHDDIVGPGGINPDLLITEDPEGPHDDIVGPGGINPDLLKSTSDDTKLDEEALDYLAVQQEASAQPQGAGLTGPEGEIVAVAAAPEQK